jgi:MoxR-like ATPase
MRYKKLFDPQPDSSAMHGHSDRVGQRTGDRPSSTVYVYTEQIVLSVNVALATGRPLLVRGPSGSGKSSLAPNVARQLGWRYYEEVISSRTQARDLLWRFDTLRRLSDAQTNRLQEGAAPYIVPGVLWWAFDRTSAQWRAATPAELHNRALTDPNAGAEHERAVVLFDEIDKADPDVPNDLLVPIGSLNFVVQESGAVVQANHPPLLIITSNDERELPAAFLRRCVVVVLPRPDEQRLVAIATAHFGPDYESLYRTIARQLLASSQEKLLTRQDIPSAAEFLDTISACLELGITPEADPATWEAIAGTTLWKQRDLLGPLR